MLERPFPTFGLPRDVFIPMAGVAEFTLGFGLVATPLVRRLSAVALFVIFNAAVYPFGRVDLVGHALITAVPLGLAAALTIFAAGYLGLHQTFCGTTYAASGERATHTYSPEHPHGPQEMNRAGGAGSVLPAANQDDATR